jgi:hypothetical protein
MFALNFLRRLRLVPRAAPPAPIADGVPLKLSKLIFPLGPPPGARLTQAYVREIARFLFLGLAHGERL